MTKNKTSLGHSPSQQKWMFDDKVTECFEDMLKRSIPEYDLMRIMVNDLVRKFRIHGTSILDLGSSRGDSIKDLLDLDNIFELCEVSKPMLEVLHKNFDSCSNVRIHDMDIREKFPHCNAGTILSILTLQFVPIEYRQQIIQHIYDNLYHGGAFIFVEKVLGNTAYLNRIFTESYLEMKASNGYSPEDIERKKLSLEGVLVPVTTEWNQELLKQAGFKQIDVFWKYYNFVGIVAIK